MELQKSDCNLKLHLRIIYAFLVINLTLCSLCLYLLNKQTYSGHNSNVTTIYSGNYTTENVEQREKRDIYSSYYHSVSFNFVKKSSGFLRCCPFVFFSFLHCVVCSSSIYGL